MVRASTSGWRPTKRWSPLLFLVGGWLLVGHTMLLGVQAFSSLPTPPDLFGPAGHLVALLGLFGLYPTVADRTPILARIAGGVAIVGTGTWALLTGTRSLAVAGVVPSVSDVLPGVFFVVVFASTIFTYILFGVAALRVDSDSRLVGGLLLAPAALLVVVLVFSAISSVSAAGGVLVGSGLALSMVALGHTLRTWDHPTNQEVPTGDVSVR